MIIIWVRSVEDDVEEVGRTGQALYVFENRLFEENKISQNVESVMLGPKPLLDDFR